MSASSIFFFDYNLIVCITCKLFLSTFLKLELPYLYKQTKSLKAEIKVFKRWPDSLAL